MPELPEVETVRATLEDQLGHVGIEDVEVLYPRIVDQEIADFLRIKGQHFLEYRRFGKYLLFVCEDVVLISHLRMEGKYYILDEQEPYNQHVHVIFKLSNGKTLQYHDTRKFGRMKVVDKEQWKEELEKHHVIRDAIDESIQAIDLYHEFHHKKISLKKLLLDQSFLAGIGNIYCDEICFSCGLDPRSRVYDLSKRDFENILFHTRRILNGAILSGGTTIRSYTSSLGVHGLFQLKLKVHGQKKCAICQQDVIKFVCEGRGTYRCPQCQKRKRKRG